MALSPNFFPQCERSRFTSVHNNTVTLLARKYSHIQGPMELRVREAQANSGRQMFTLSSHRSN
jgi:hypothetical protein